MVAEAGHLAIALVIELQTLFQIEIGHGLGLDTELVLNAQLVLEGDRGIESTEDLCAEFIHHALQVIIQTTSVYTVEQEVIRFLALREADQAVIDVSWNWDGVLITNGVLSEEVKLDHVGLRELHILYLKRAAAHSVGFVFTLLITHTKSQVVNQESTYSKLIINRVLRAYLFVIVDSNRSNVLLQSSCLLILFAIILALDLRLSCQEHILPIGILASLILEVAKPSGLGIRLDALPRMSGDWTYWDWIISANIQAHKLRDDPLLDSAHVRMLSAAAEYAWGLHEAVGDLLKLVVNQAVLEVGLCLALLFLFSLPFLNWSILPLFSHLLQICLYRSEVQVC